MTFIFSSFFGWKPNLLQYNIRIHFLGVYLIYISQTRSIKINVN